jgi:UDP-glucose 4-epimerase
MSVYGPGNGSDRFTEDLQPNPKDPYAISKYACEMDIQSAGEMHGLDWCIIRPHNVYGKKQNIWDKYRNVLGIWMYQKLNNKPLTIYGDGEQTRAFSYIDDCLEPMWKAAILPEASNEIINLGGIHGCSINDAMEVMQEVIGVTPIIRCEERYEIKHAVPSFQKSIDILGYKETTTLKEGLSEMWEWAKTQPNRRQYVWEKFELEDKIYTYWKND